MTIKPEYLNKAGRLAYALAMTRALANALDTNWSVSDTDANKIIDALEPVVSELNEQDFFGTEGWERWFD